MKAKYSLLFLMLMILGTFKVQAAITALETKGWFESGYITWTPVGGATDYSVYVRPEGGTYTKLDKELVRKYPTYYRADAVGLKAGNYQFKVVASNGEEVESAVFTATAHDRYGFAHAGRTEGVGAYNNDGTLKANARVLYVTANNAKTVTLDMQVDSKGTMQTRTGLQDIIQAYEKGQEKRPLAVRIIGTVKNADMDAFGSSAEGLQVKGNGSSKCVANLTIEGIGNDATIHGFGILCRSISSVEFRNFAIMICLDDCLSLDTDNRNIWIHNMDFFYGGTGSAADQAKGDGTVDIKGGSSHVTVSYNHFYDSGKCSLGGMKSETTDCWMTYHHNWFDHSDSRHPRIRTAFYHIYNNYFDGNSKYGVGVTMGGSAFVESNYFRNCKYPMLSSKQGTDAQGDGTFSGENGGVIKAFGNFIKNPKQVLYYDGKQTDGVWDAVKANSRDENVTALAFTGATSYNNAATTAAISAVPEAAISNVEEIPAIVRGELGAGRCGHGDFDWKFLNSVEDINYGVITELKSALLAYKSTLLGFADGTSIKNGGATAAFTGGDGQAISQEKNDEFIPSWGAGGDTPEDIDYEEEPYIANADGTDFYWVGDNNVANTEKLIADGIITLGNSQAKNATTGEYYTSKFASTYAGNDTYPSEHVGSLQLGQASAGGTYNGGTATFYCPNGVTSFKINALRTGKAYYIVERSTDGTNFVKVAEVNGASAGILSKDFSTAVRDLESTDPIWVRITNGSTGGLNILGVLINQLATDVVPLPESDLTAVTKEVELALNGTHALVPGVDYTTTSDGAVSFSSSKATVAMVSADGVITAIGEGTAVITISQAKTSDFRAGTATITVTVKDSREASTLQLVSDASITLKEGETSAIVTTGGTGTKTIVSSNTDVATVDADGNITAVSTGSAVITISDEGSATSKPGSLTVTVSVIKDMTGVEVCDFVAKAPSSSMVTVSGNYSNSKGTISYGGKDYVMCVKMESATDINITPSADCKVTLIFGTAETGKKFKLDGVTLTTDSKGMYEFDGKAGTTYNLKKGDTINLFLVVFTPATSTGITATSASPAAASAIYDLSGRKISAPAKGIRIVNGKKVIIR